MLKAFYFRFEKSSTSGCIEYKEPVRLNERVTFKYQSGIARSDNWKFDHTLSCCVGAAG